MEDATNADIIAMHKEWDEISCPICLDHPHNAVLLICSSHENGCRSYICDTSYRHSNCLDRFRKPKPNHGDFSLVDENLFAEQHHMRTDQPLRTNFTGNGNEGVSEPMPESGGNLHDQNVSTQEHEWIDREGRDNENMQELSVLKCPLCRGSVSGWVIAKKVRQYLDLKQRCCYRELCSFSGNYRELRRHARGVHPSTRPTDVDPSRQREWRHLESQREYGDILSALRSAMPGAVVFGDFVIDNGNDVLHEHDFGENGGPWLATFFLLHMMSSSSIDLVDEPRGYSRSWRAHRRPYGHRMLWGRNLLGLQDDDDDEDDVSLDDDAMLPRRRRRFAGSRHEEQ